MRGGGGVYNLSLNESKKAESFPLQIRTKSLVISEDFWVFLSFLSDRSVFIYPPAKVLTILRSLVKSKRNQKSINQKNPVNPNLAN